MKFSLNQLLAKTAMPDPSWEEVVTMRSRYKGVLKRCGMKTTPLIKESAPSVMRYLFDDKDLNHNCRDEGGKPMREAPRVYRDSVNGLALLGNVGTGKSSLLRVVAAITKAHYFTLSELVKIFSRDEASGFWQEMTRIQGDDLILDDLGTESDARSYGTSFPIRDLLYDRYDLWVKTGVKLHIATNLNKDEFKETYGERVLDRIKEMCVVVPCEGASLRKKAEVAATPEQGVK